MHPNVAGALVNGALFLAGVFVMGLVTNHPAASNLALSASAIAFGSHVAQMVPDAPRSLCLTLIVVSWLLAVAGLAFLPF